MYANILDSTNVPQTEQLNERQTKNRASGFTYTAENWQQLDRFLILGALGNTYYFGARELAKLNCTSLLSCLAEDGERVVARLVEVSTKGLAPKNDHAIFALALAMKHGNDATRTAAYAAVPHVCRTGTHLFSLVAEADGLKKGWGRGMCRAIGDWYLAKEADSLAFQIIKYPSRNNYSHRDLLRLAHPKTEDPKKASVLIYAAGNKKEREPIAIIEAVEALRSEKDPAIAANLIREHRIPREAVPTELLNELPVWEALLVAMPITALVRNLGKMTSIGLLSATNEAVLTVGNKLLDAKSIEKSLIHPLQILLAMKTYARGAGFRGSLSWTPVPAINSALSEAFARSFKYLKPTGLKTLVAIDVSGSMSTPRVADGQLTLFEAAGCMALAVANAEPLCSTVVFDTSWAPIDIKGRRLDDVTKDLGKRMGGGTDFNQAIYAAESMVGGVDLIVIYTDNETWAGYQHPEVALAKLREKNPNVKVVVASMVASSTMATDPKDAGVLQCVGFDASLPQVISAFAGVTAEAVEDDTD